MKKFFKNVLEVVCFLFLMIAFKFVGMDKDDESIEEYKGNMF